VFGGLALLLAAIGLYGVIAYGVASRTSEIGVRIAVGARPSEILRLIIADGGRMIGAGIALGLVGGLLTARLAAAFLFDASTADPTSCAAVALSLMVTGVVACYIPARRAMRLNPISAVRSE
jgi:putative ABC transport system permease protein